MSKEQHIYDLAALAEKWLNGTITDEERQRFESWYASFDDGNIDLEGSKYSNEEQLRAAILTRIKNSTIRTEKKQHNLFRRIVSVAAVLMLAVGIGVYFYLENNHPVEQKIVSKKDIAPGHSGAILTLADGKQVVLDSTSGAIAQQGNAQITNLTGQLVYNANNATVANVSYNTLTTPRAREYKIVLPDGTQVWLNAASSITYPTMFTGARREVSITGEAYFEVTHNAAKPFVVIHDGMQVKVLGTHFDVNTYSDESVAKVTLLEGRVEVAKNKKNILLVPGQQAQLGKNNVHVSDNVDVEEVLAWKNGKFQFGEKTDIATIMRELSRWYDVDVEYSGPINGHIGGSISRNVNASQVLQMLEATGSVHFKIQGNKIIVMPGED